MKHCISSECSRPVSCGVCLSLLNCPRIACSIPCSESGLVSLGIQNLEELFLPLPPPFASWNLRGSSSRSGLPTAGQILSVFSCSASSNWSLWLRSMQACWKACTMSSMLHPRVCNSRNLQQSAVTESEQYICISRVIFVTHSSGGEIFLGALGFRPHAHFGNR